jgi:hypothetical protein
MDVTMDSRPRFQFGPPNDFGPQLDGEPEYPIFVFPPLLPVGQAVGLLPGFLRSTSFKLRPSIPGYALTVLPFTVAVAKPGLLHVVLDTAFYTGSHLALDALRDWARRDLAWGEKTRDELLYDSLQQYLAGQPYLFGPGGSVTVIIEMPPAWLTDP